MRSLGSSLTSVAEQEAPVWLIGDKSGRGSTGDARIRPRPLPCSSAPAAAVRRGSCWRRRRAALQQWSAWPRQRPAWLRAGTGRHRSTLAVFIEPLHHDQSPDSPDSFSCDYSCGTRASPAPQSNTPVHTREGRSLCDAAWTLYLKRTLPL